MPSAVEMFGRVSLPAWSTDQPARDESNSWVKKRGNGVEEGSGVRVGSEVGVAGIGVGEAGTVAVEGRVGSGDGVAVWQALIRMRHPIRMNFFMALLITQMSSAQAGHS